MENAKVRINKFDNLKGLAIILIILGHLPVLLPTGIDHKLIYMIDLPLFFFVAGYFSKIGPEEPIKAFKRLLIPYFLFCCIFFVFNIYVLGGGTKALFFYPASALWFLMSLFIMKMILPIFDRFRFPILIALLCALLIGCLDIPANILGFTRAFAYLPVFLVGFYFKDYKAIILNKWGFLSNISSRNIWLLFIAVLVVTLVFINLTPMKLIYIKNPYEGHYLWNILMRFIIIMLGIALTLLFNEVMTNRKCILTQIGKNSMAVYVLHIYFTKSLKKFVFIKGSFIMSNEIVLAICVISCALMLAFVLSRNVVTKCLNKIIDLIYGIFVKIA